MNDFQSRILTWPNYKLNGSVARFQKSLLCAFSLEAAGKETLPKEGMGHRGVTGEGREVKEFPRKEVNGDPRMTLGTKQVRRNRESFLPEDEADTSSDISEYTRKTFNGWQRTRSFPVIRENSSNEK